MVVLQSFLQGNGLPFFAVLDEQEVEQAFEAEGALFGKGKKAVYTAALSLWGLLSQVMAVGDGRTYVAAVERIRILCLVLGIRVPSGDTGAYCRARAKIPVSVLEHLTYAVADNLEKKIPRKWLWHNRHVKMVDGSTVMVPDTPENQAEWPQSSSQEPGLGFPIIRLCAVFSLATGALCGLADGPCKGKETGETAMLRALFDRLNRGDILLGDRYFCSYFMIALLKDRGVDIVFRQHQRRMTDFRTGERLDVKDHIARWSKPDRPPWMDQATYDDLPAELAVREFEIPVTTPGFRPKKIIVVTTLTNARRYSKKDLGDLYRNRWSVEVDLRSLKIHLHMEDPRGQSPDQIRRELWASCLAYNLIRTTMAQAAKRHRRRIRKISFSGAKQAITSAFETASTADGELLKTLAESKFESIARRKVGHRPNRVEPRAIKRRPKKQKLLTTPRKQARRALLKSSHSAA